MALHQKPKIDDEKIEQDSSQTGDQFVLLNSKVLEEESDASSKNDEISSIKSNESPVLKIVKLVADLKETASENIGKLLNAKIDESENTESTTSTIPNQLEPNDSSNILVDNGKFSSFF